MRDFSFSPENSPAPRPTCLNCANPTQVIRHCRASVYLKNKIFSKEIQNKIRKQTHKQCNLFWGNSVIKYGTYMWAKLAIYNFSSPPHWTSFSLLFAAIIIVPTAISPSRFLLLVFDNWIPLDYEQYRTPGLVHAFFSSRYMPGGLKRDK